MHSHTSIHTFHTPVTGPYLSHHHAYMHSLTQAIPESAEATQCCRLMASTPHHHTFIPPTPLSQAIPESGEATQRFRRLVASTANYSAATHKALCAETQEHRVDLAFAVRGGGRKGHGPLAFVVRDRALLSNYDTNHTAYPLPCGSLLLFPPTHTNLPLLLCL